VECGPSAANSLDDLFGSNPASGPSLPPTQIEHVYVAGTFTATLTVTDAAGESAFDTAQLTVFPAPTVALGGGYATSPSSAMIYGTANPNGGDTTYAVRYGTTPSLGSSTSLVDIGSGTKPVAINLTLVGLAPHTPYYWCINASNASGDASSSLGAFTTGGGAPMLQSVGYTILGATSVQLSGTINPRQVDTVWYFEWGTGTNYGSSIPMVPSDLGSGTGAVQVSICLGQLVPHTTYHFALVGVNAVGVVTSIDHVIKM